MHKRPVSHRPWSLRRILGAVLVVAVLGGLAVVGVNVGLGRWQIHPVLSGSMRPGLAVGSVVVMQREPVSDLAVRDVILTNPPGEPHFDIVHRVVSITPAPGGPVVQTMGDDNSAPDPWRVKIRSPYIYQARFSVPLLGYVALYLHGPRGRKTLLAIAAFLLLLAAAGSLWQRRGHRLADPPRSLPAPPAEAATSQPAATRRPV